MIALGVFGALAVVIAIGGAGMAALLFIWMTKASLGTRTLISAFGTPMTMLLPLLVIVMIDGGNDSPSDIIGMGVILIVAALVIAWPASFIVGRALDRSRAVDHSIFE